jgi:hypothetical protein
MVRRRSGEASAGVSSVKRKGKAEQCSGATCHRRSGGVSRRHWVGLVWPMSLVAWCGRPGWRCWAARAGRVARVVSRPCSLSFGSLARPS